MASTSDWTFRQQEERDSRPRPCLANSPLHERRLWQRKANDLGDMIAQSSLRYGNDIVVQDM
jgi:hypothetical protein